MLQQTPENCNELVVNETSEEFKILLKHIYPPMLAAGNRIETEEEGCRLLEMSHEYVIPALKAAAENFLSQVCCLGLFNGYFLGRVEIIGISREDEKELGKTAKIR